MATRSLPPMLRDQTAQRRFFTRIRHWTLSRIVVEAAALVITIAVASRLLSLAIPPAPSPLHVPLAMLRNLFEVALLLAVYSVIIQSMERRRAVEIDLRPGRVQFPVGVVIGMTLMSVVYFILWTLGVAAFGPGTGLRGLGAGLVVAFLAAVFEELLLRAVLFRIVEQACGTTLALLVSAIVFGVLHGANPGATLFSDAAIAIEAGLLLAMAYALTRNLWLAIGIHAGWNFTEGNLFGAQISGMAGSSSLLHGTLTGPALLTGGRFGPEASIVAIGVCGLAAVALGIMVVRRGGWRPLALRLTLP